MHLSTPKYWYDRNIGVFIAMIKQPVNQKLITNMAIVRLKRQGKKFEVACYRNKVTDWRNKAEDDINQVL